MYIIYFLVAAGFTLGLMGLLENKRSIFIFKTQPCIYFLWPFRILLPIYSQKRKLMESREFRNRQVENRLNGH